MTKDCGKILSGCGCCWLLIFIVIFIPLYLRGTEDVYKTKCEILDRKSSSCTRCTGSGSNRRCYISTKYKYKYEIRAEKCNGETFSEWAGCGGGKYKIGKKRTCYLKNNNCDDVTFSSNNRYLIGAWVMLGFGCIAFVIYLIGLYIYHKN